MKKYEKDYKRAAALLALYGDKPQPTKKDIAKAILFQK